ncbi:MAG: hypothetical protein WBY44_24840 [Bryobacteraceae bacterium]
MRNIMLPVLATAALALVLASPSIAADKPTAKTNQTAMKSSASHGAWASQQLSGTLMIVDADKKLVVIQTSDGVPYDLDITRATRIKNGDQTISLRDLNQDINKNVFVKLVPERHGDIATSIHIGA